MSDIKITVSMVLDDPANLADIQGILDSFLTTNVANGKLKPGASYTWNKIVVPEEDNGTKTFE